MPNYKLCVNAWRKQLRKILIFGNSGSGKTTLAKKLAKSNNLSHLDLDTVAWMPSVKPERAPISESQSKLIEFMKESDNWVIEGCYTNLLELVCHDASEIIFMNLSVNQCIENSKTRPWEPHKYESKEAQDKNLEMLINWIRDYTIREDVFSYKSHMGFYEKFSGRKTMYTSNETNT